MKITREQLDAVMLDDEGDPYDDKATLAQVLRSLVKAQMFVGPDGRPASFDESPEDKVRIGMVAFKVARAVKAVHLSTEDVSALKRRAVRLLDAINYVRVVDLLEGKSSAEVRAEKENDEAKS